LSFLRHHVSTVNCDSACYTLVTALQQRVIDATIDKMACTTQSMCACWSRIFWTCA